MAKQNIILGIETSCDETAAAVLKKEGDKITILSNVIASSASLQSQFGGIIPEQAARQQLSSIIPVIKEAITQANLYPPLSKSHLPPSTIHPPAIDAIAVTFGPGLIGSLLVGVETAKTLSLIWQKPLIPVNHLLGHFYANWITCGRVPAKSELVKYSVQLSAPPSTMSENKNLGRNKPKVSRVEGRTVPLQPDQPGTTPTFPCLGLLVSGGHTDLVLFKNHQDYEYLGGTRDDAAGECFDKCARLLGLPYPGGPEISKLAQKGNPTAFNLPRPMINSNNFDFSYSGLKTAVSNLISSERRLPPNAVSPRLDEGERIRGPKRPQDASVSEQESGVADLSKQTLSLSDLCTSIEAAIIDPLVKKTLQAAKKYNIKNIMIAGGVAANDKLRSELQLNAKRLTLNAHIFVPQKSLCTDNASMIASRAFFEEPLDNPLTLQANPNLNLENKK